MRLAPLVRLSTSVASALAAEAGVHSELKSSSASVAQPLVRFEVHYTSATVDVGNWDIMRQAYVELLAAADDNGVELHKMDRVKYKQCDIRGKVQHLDVTFDAEGAWGEAGPISKHVMKWQMLNIAGHMLDRLSKPFRWQLYSDCVGEDDLKGSHDVPCGPQASRTCLDVCYPTEATFECNEFSWAHRLPVSISIRAYNVADGSLRADELHLKFSSVTHRHSMRCGMAVAAFMVALDWVNMDIIRFNARAMKGYNVLHPIEEEVLSEEAKVMKNFEKVTENPRWDSFSFALLFYDSVALICKSADGPETGHDWKPT